MYETVSPQNTGLLTCYQNRITSYCIVKTIQCTLSCLMIIWVLIEGYLQVTKLRQSRYNYIILVMILLVLFSNVFFCLWNNIYTLYSLETFFNNLYFLAIVGYVIVQYLQKTNSFYERYRVVYIVGILINGLLFFFIFVDSLIEGKQVACEEIWYLCVNAECIFLSLVVVTILIINQREQQQKLFLLSQTGLNLSVSNPLTTLWLWIGINVFAQIINLIESGLFLNASPKNRCRILESQAYNQLLMFLFVLFSMYAEYIATLCYLGYLRRRILRSMDMHAQRIEIISFQYETINNNKFGPASDERSYQQSAL